MIIFHTIDFDYVPNVCVCSSMIIRYTLYYTFLNSVIFHYILLTKIFQYILRIDLLLKVVYSVRKYLLKYIKEFI